MDMPMDYHMWGAMLEHYQIHMPKLTNIMLRWISVLSTTRNYLLYEFTNQAIVSLLATDFDRGLLQLVGNDIVNSLFKYWVSYVHVESTQLLDDTSSWCECLPVCVCVCVWSSVQWLHTGASVKYACCWHSPRSSSAVCKLTDVVQSMHVGTHIKHGVGRHASPAWEDAVCQTTDR